MSRTKREKNRYWSKEEKLRIVNRVIVDGLSTKKVSDTEDISNGMLCRWIKSYLELGENALENKRKPGNPLAKYSSRKELTDIEKLEYENIRLRIENERLKKGYMMKGDGSYVMYKK